MSRRSTTLIKLGDCMGFTYCGEDDEDWEQTFSPYLELYTTPSKKALLVIDSSGARAVLVAAAWGGKLDVKPAGIVG